MSKKYLRTILVAICFIAMNGLQSASSMAAYTCDKLLNWCLEHWFNKKPGPHCYVYKKYGGSEKGEKRCEDLAHDDIQYLSACQIGAKTTFEEKRCTNYKGTLDFKE